MLGLSLLCALLMAIPAAAQSDSIEISAKEASSMYKSVSMGRVSIHDPSIVYNGDGGAYYLFGSHRAQAQTKTFQSWTSFTAPWGKLESDGSITSGAANSEAFETPEVTTTTQNGKTLVLPSFDAEAWAALGSDDYSVDGMMWAPDVIYNTELKKWCMYLSINGDNWCSSVILLTSDTPTGTYTYQAPIVISGFRNTDIPYSLTDIELALDSLTSLPSRYLQNQAWGTYWPNCIDPCVFYDEEGQLWLTYGSWSGGIFILRLDNATGLRDYSYAPASDYATKKASFTADPYFGKKIAGGYYVSGEGSYVEHIGDYYYLFVTYGELAPDGGYEMRVFRSADPEGPYKGPKGNAATYTSWVKNYGQNADTRGEKILGAYTGWGFMIGSEISQGHNSIMHTVDDQNLLVYHTKFTDGTAGHQVRVHQVYVNEDGWLVAAPFEYHNETTRDDDIKSVQPFTIDEIAGTYNLLIHKYSMDYENLETVSPITVYLSNEGKITGDKSGSWSITEGTAYITLTISGTVYKGVVTDQQMDGYSLRAVCFSAMASSGVNIWGYKTRDDYALAYAINNMDMPLTNRQIIKGHVNIDDVLKNTTDVAPDVSYSWTSSDPDHFSAKGRYNPTGLTEDEDVTMTLHLTSGLYTHDETLSLNVKADTATAGDYAEGMKAYYSFDAAPFLNAFNTEEKATKKRQSGATAVANETDNDRQSQYEHVFGAEAGKAGYLNIDNPLLTAALTDGATISFWLKRGEDDKTGTLAAFYNPETEHTLYITGNTYIRFEEDDSTWLDYNNPSTTTPSSIPYGEWALLTVIISPDNGYTVYVNGKRKYINRYNGELDGSAVTGKNGFDFTRVFTHIASCDALFLGYSGSDNGTAEACYDDLIVYDRALSDDDVSRLYGMETRTFDFNSIAEGVETVFPDGRALESDGVYNLKGQKINGHTLSKNIYIVDCKKIVK